jgi:protein translocase SecG subunit
MTIAGILPYIQVSLSLLLIVTVLLQQTGSSLGGAFGGDNFSAAYHTRRGAEKYLFYSTIVLLVLFALSAFVALLIQ